MKQRDSSNATRKQAKLFGFPHCTEYTRLWWPTVVCLADEAAELYVAGGDVRAGHPGSVSLHAELYFTA